MKDFGKSFGDADEIILADIYAAREPKDKSINSKILAEEIIKKGNKAKYMESFDKITDFLFENTKKAMSLSQWARGIFSKLEKV